MLTCVCATSSVSDSSCLVDYLDCIFEYSGKKMKENRDLLSDRSSLVKAQQNCIDLNTVFSYW